MILLVLWAYDPARWGSAIEVAVTLLLLILAVLQHVGLATALLMFWGAFWVGILVPAITLWGRCTDRQQWRRRPNEATWRA